jgi:hypothetical protein
MAVLVSPGVSVTVTDESFFIPVSAATVPLFFIATQDEKLQSDGVSEALGTFEHDVIRTVTSLKQSTELYGTPVFLKDSGTNAAYHGDCRNEYGVFALNQYLGIGNKAYVVRANVNLNDDLTSIRDLWDIKVAEATAVLDNLISAYLLEQDAIGVGSPPVPQLPGTTTHVDAATLRSLAQTATTDLFAAFSFVAAEADYFGAVGVDSALDIYPSGYDAAPVGTYAGFNFLTDGGASPVGMWTPNDGAALLQSAADDFKFTFEFLTDTSLGANDADRRANIVTALQSSVISNTDIRSESFDYNLVLCPGYPELSDELFSLVTDIADEAMIISDCPMDKDVDGITNATTGWAATSARTRSEHIAYYYPSALATNLDGENVACAASGVALRTITYSDSVSFLWFAPAGIRRGLISGVSELGYVSGALGGPTSFIPLALNPGERDALYQYAAGGDINPLVFFPGQGFVVWGQKTSAAAASAVDRINVKRLMAYIKRQLRKNTLSFVFQPNDALTRDNLKAVVDNFLGDLIVKRGLYDFVTVCDESNNTPDRIDRNEMYVDIAVKPVKAAEFIYIPIRIVATGAEI